MRRFLVSSFLAELTQQIHSFRASGVISAQSPLAAASDSMALRKSGGRLCTVPPEIVKLHARNASSPTRLSSLSTKSCHSTIDDAVR